MSEQAEMQDGAYELAMGDYLALPFVSSSLLKEMRSRTPAWVYWTLNGGTVDDDTAAKRLGSIVHTAIFEPDFLEAMFLAKPAPDPEKHTTASGAPSSNPANTKAYREEVEALEAEHPDKEMVDAAVYARAMEMRDAVHQHPRASALIHMDGPVEHSIIVTDPETGVRCKIRPDKLCNPFGANLQAKTTRNARRDVFANDVWRFGYYMSEALYARLLRAHGFELRHPLILAIESEGPITADGVCVYELDEGTMDAGDQMCSRYLRQIAWCFENDAWPGHPQDSIPSLSLPPHVWTRVDEELMDPPACLPAEAIAEREVAHV